MRCTKFEAPLLSPLLLPFDKLLDEEVIRFEESPDWLLTYMAGACVLQFVNFLRRAAPRVSSLGKKSFGGL